MTQFPASRGQIADVQNLADHRRIDIDKVGVKNISYPITVRDKARGEQQTVASVNMYVNLPHQHKGTHMSRFVEILSERSHELDIKNFHHVLDEIKRRLDAQSAHIELTFPYFIKKQAPVSGAEGMMEYQVKFLGSSGPAGQDLVVEVRVPVTTLCPCSKEISVHGAHNQRGIARVSLRFDKFIWIEDIIELIEASASSPVFSVLKRDDERFVTDQAYDNPMFVEDVVREIARKLDADDNITWFEVETENFESIHNHSAYAFIERDKRCHSAPE